MNIQEILAKETLEDSDIQFLMAHKDELSDSDLVRLGLKAPGEVSPEAASIAPEAPAEVESGPVETRRRRKLTK